MAIEVKHITKKYQNKLILDDVNLTVATGEMIALLGPSGSGKTTLLRIIAGLDTSNEGEILIEGENTLNKKLQERKIGFVFQHYALFRHLNVFENIAFGLKAKPFRQRPSKSQVKNKVHDLLCLMHLEGYERHFPNQLSGGQQQRVALARALAVDPKVLLLDEPFGALDTKVRKRLSRWVRLLHEELKISSIFVTHDQEEALSVANRIGIMEQGRIIQLDTPSKICRHPADRFVFEFLGDYNEFDGWLDEHGKHYLTYPTDQKNLIPKKIYSRPHQTKIKLQPDETFTVKTRIKHINTTSSLVKLETTKNKDSFYQVEITHTEFKKLQLKKGDVIYIRPRKIFVFD